MGILMWHEDNNLSNIIILDIFEYFIIPICRIICKHTPTNDDPTSHLLPIHKECMKLLPQDWVEFIDNGIVTERLLRLIIKNTIYPISLTGKF